MWNSTTFLGILNGVVNFATELFEKYKICKKVFKVVNRILSRFFFFNLQLIFLIVKSQVVLGRIMYSIIDPIGVCLAAGAACKLGGLHAVFVHGDSIPLSVCFTV